MCGLVGIFDLVRYIRRITWIRRSIVSATVGWTAWCGKIGPSWMAHVRLAVVDPENGHQPMTNADGSVHVMLRRDLQPQVNSQGSQGQGLRLRRAAILRC